MFWLGRPKPPWNAKYCLPSTSLVNMDSLGTSPAKLDLERGAGPIPTISSVTCSSFAPPWWIEIIDALGLSVSKAAELLKVRRATLSDLLHGKASLTPEMALPIEKAFGPDMDHLLRMQVANDVAQTQRHSSDITAKRYVPA
jgi:addiction module HigA family antidote